MIKFAQKSNYLNALHWFGFKYSLQAQPWALIGWTVPSWRHPRWEWWSKLLPAPQGFCFLQLKETKTHPPRWRRRTPTSRPNFFFGFAKLIALRAYAPDRQVFHFQNAITGDILEVPMPIPRDWVAGSQTAHLPSWSIRNELRLGLVPLRHDAVSATEALAMLWDLSNDSYTCTFLCQLARRHSARHLLGPGEGGG